MAIIDNPKAVPIPLNTPVIGPTVNSPAAVNPTVASVPAITPQIVPRSQIDTTPAPVPAAAGNVVTLSVPAVDLTVPTSATSNNNVIINSPKPGGNSGAIQFNSNGKFAGGANLTFDGAKTQSIGYGVPLLTTMYDSLAGGILNTTGEVRVGNINTNASQTGSAGLGRLRYQRSGPVPGGAAGQVAFYGFKAKDNQFTTLTFENNNLSSVALVMGATAPYDASGVPGYVGFGGNGTVFGISGSYYVSPGGANRMSNGGASENWSPFLNLDGRGNLTIGGGITMTPPAFRPWFTAGGRNDPDGPAINCGITFADGTFQNTAAVISLTVQEEGSNVVVNTNTINFVGNGVVASNVAGIATITIAGSDSSSGITVQEEGANTVTSANTINFVGSSVTTSNVAGVATITVASGLSGIAVQEEGSNVVASANTVNFVGSLVTSSNVSGVATVAVKGPAVQEEGSNVVANTDTLNFVGTLITASNVAGVATVTVNGPAVQEEGSNVVASTSILNFVGAGVTASNIGGVATITIPGGGGNGTPGSPTASIQFNDGGSFAGNSYFTFSKTNGNVDLSLGNLTVSNGNITGTTNGVTLGYRYLPGNVVTGNRDLAASDVGGHIVKWGNSDITLTTPGFPGDSSIPVGAKIEIFNANPGGNANIFAGSSGGTNTVLVGPRPNSEGILSYVQVGPYEQVTLVKLGASASGTYTGNSVVWFCYGSAYPLGVAYP
jgi:filamentous hemagglutinin